MGVGEQGLTSAVVSSGGCQCGYGCYDYVVKWWMSVWVWML